MADDVSAYVHDNRQLLLASSSARSALAKAPIAPGKPYDSKREQFAMVLLNSSDVKGPLLPPLWRSAEYIVCADGGANALHDYIWENEHGKPDESLRVEHLPNAIVGDLDSIRLEVKSYYSNHGVSVQQVEDQDLNDAEKCIQHVLQLKSSGDVVFDCIVLFGAFGGRFDQEMTNINILYKYSDKACRLLLLSHENCGELLCPGSHRIYPSVIEGPTCGLLPVGGDVADISCSGLQWNLSNARLSFTGLISSCNLIVDSAEKEEEKRGAERCVEVTTSHHVMWTTSIRSPLQESTRTADANSAAQVDSDSARENKT